MSLFTNFNKVRQCHLFKLLKYLIDTKLYNRMIKARTIKLKIIKNEKKKKTFMLVRIIKVVITKLIMIINNNNDKQ